MRKSVKFWLILALCLLAAGLVICVAGMSILGFDLENLSTQKMVTNTYAIEDRFSNIRIDATTVDISILPAEDGKVRVACVEEETMQHHVEVEGDALVITQSDDRKWYDHIGIFSYNQTLTVYLPAGAYGDLQIRGSTGDVRVSEQIKFQNADVKLSTGDANWEADVAQDLSISCSTGHVRTDHVKCGNLNVLTDTGTVKLCNTVVSGLLDVQVDTGDVMLDRVDGAEICILTDTGDVTGTILSDKIFITDTDTGDVTVPASVEGGRCTVKTDTGDIRLEIVE